MTDTAPNPGTRAAVAAGCICPVLDNNHGQFPVFRDEDGRDQWWITEGCSVHHPEPEGTTDAT